MTIAVRRSGFTIPLSLVVLTSTAMLLAGCQSGGASNANQQGTAGSSSSAKTQSTASAKPTSGQQPAHASPRIPSPTGKGAGESSSPQSSASTGARPSSPRASEPRPAASGTQSSGSGAASSGASKASTQNGGASKAPEAGGSASQPSGPQVDTSQPAQPAAPDAQTAPAPAPAPADNSGDADKTTPAPAPAEPAAPQAEQATSFVPDNLVSEKTAMIVSPSGNIGCDLSANYAGCGVLSYRSDGTFGQDSAGSPNWWFDLSSGATPQIGGRGEGAFSLDESFRGGGSSSPQVVEYGQSVVFGSWVCSSEETGMTCRNTETGHGVFLSSARYETF
ncbi:hypothetical protein [Actinomyces sp. Marseille-P3109]|uniref:hypothetical protein n=1 Tax=Actinomyces sp. Marseille-P3109 TaxID=2083009 RepID=UPI000D560128|nr:hypothetical protein [Actinomyces sp. Marseille-P3109]